MKFWFVNLGKYYKEQRDGRYLWAPIRSKKGGILPHWDSLKDVNKGDIILCNNNGKIFSVGIAKEPAYACDIPEEFHQNWRPEGRRIDLKFIDIDKTIKYKDYKDYILKEIDPNECPFDVNGNAKMGYLYPLDKKIAIFLLNKMNNEAVNNLLAINDYDLEYEIEERREEEEQFEKINSGSIKSYSKEELSKIEEDNADYQYVPKYDNGRKKVLRETTDGNLKATRMKEANYLCEINPNHKTFTSISGQFQYLECHHIIPMKAQKDFPNIKLDSMFNLIAVCPICHMQVHHAEKKERVQIFQKMYKTREKEMLEHGFDLAKINKIFYKYY